jgi:hypothetical protein
MKTAIMVIPNKPWEAPWMLRQYDNSDDARAEAYQMAQRREKRDSNDPERYKVNGMVY